MYQFILTIHIIAATIWTGGHLVLALTILPRVLKNRDVAGLERFEQGYEKIGIPALIIQVLSGLWLAHRLLPFANWFSFETDLAKLIALKLGLLLITILFAMDARFRIIPKLSPDNLVSLAYHIIPVTIISVLFVVAGVSFRFGKFFF